MIIEEVLVVTQPLLNDIVSWSFDTNLIYICVQFQQPIGCIRNRICAACLYTASMKCN